MHELANSSISYNSNNNNTVGYRNHSPVARKMSSGIVQMSPQGNTKIYSKGNVSSQNKIEEELKTPTSTTATNSYLQTAGQIYSHRVATSNSQANNPDPRMCKTQAFSFQNIIESPKCNLYENSQYGSKTYQTEPTQNSTPKKITPAQTSQDFSNNNSGIISGNLGLLNDQKIQQPPPISHLQHVIDKPSEFTNFNSLLKEMNNAPCTIPKTISTENNLKPQQKKSYSANNNAHDINPPTKPPLYDNIDNYCKPNPITKPQEKNPKDSEKKTDAEIAVTLKTWEDSPEQRLQPLSDLYLQSSPIEIGVKSIVPSDLQMQSLLSQNQEKIYQLKTDLTVQLKEKHELQDSLKSARTESN